MGALESSYAITTGLFENCRRIELGINKAGITGKQRIAETCVTSKAHAAEINCVREDSVIKVREPFKSGTVERRVRFESRVIEKAGPTEYAFAKVRATEERRVRKRGARRF